MRQHRLLETFYNSRKGHEMEIHDAIHISHSSDAVAIPDQILIENDIYHNLIGDLSEIKDA